MRYRAFPLALSVLLLVFLAGRVQAQDVPIEQEGEKAKRAQTGMKFVSTSVDPRAAALGDAVTSLEMGSMSMFYNPAAMSRMTGLGDLSAANVSWIGDISYNTVALALRPGGGQYGVFGLSVRSVDYGEFERTRRADNEAGYIGGDVLGSYSPTGLALGLSYARSVTDRFSVGGTVKYVQQDLGTGAIDLSGGSLQEESFDLSTPAFDFGVMYDPGFHSMRFAMSARNFSPAIEFVEESFELPLTLNVGISMDVLDLASESLSEMHSLLVTVDSSHPRDFSEKLNFGGEYSFMDVIALRAGYSAPSDEAGISLGGGLHYDFGGLDVRADYAYSDMGIFSDVNRIAIGVGF